jgi:hypothetical protein
MKYIMMTVASIIVFSISGCGDDEKDTAATDTAVEVEDTGSEDTGSDENTGSATE